MLFKNSDSCVTDSFEAIFSTGALNVFLPMNIKRGIFFPSRQFLGFKTVVQRRTKSLPLNQQKHRKFFLRLFVGRSLKFTS